MNYIHQLQHQNHALKAEMAALRTGLNNLDRYLMSTKFPTVQTSDVLMRISEAYSAAIDARLAYVDEAVTPTSFEYQSTRRES